MPLIVVPDSLLLPFNAIQLGRLVKSTENPLEGYHQPCNSESPPLIVSQLEYAENNQHDSTASLGSSLIALLSAAFSKRSSSHVRVEPKCCKTYALDNSDAWFDKAISHEETKKWIERSAIRGSKLFMIVGIVTLTDTRFVQTSVKEEGSQDQATAPVALSLAAAGAVVPLASLVDPSTHGDFGNFASDGTRIFAPGEQIGAIQYRVIRYKWLSSRVVENLQLSKTRQWSFTEGNRRDAYEDKGDDGKDAIVVGIEEALGRIDTTLTLAVQPLGSDCSINTLDDRSSLDPTTNIMSEQTHNSTLPTSFDGAHSVCGPGDDGGSIFSIDFESGLTPEQEDQLGQQFVYGLISGLALQGKEQSTMLLEAMPRVNELLKMFARVRSCQAREVGELRAAMFIRTLRLCVLPSIPN
jgi:hypothetical protein